MATQGETDWTPETYARFWGFRLRPALDLLAQVGALPGGDIVDLGCGAGAVGPALRARFGTGRRLVGVDNSPAMLDRARAISDGGAPVYDAVEQVDIADWRPDSPPALIFSNAALHWLEGHETLLPGLVGLLAEGGVLAVQMPRQSAAPSHRLLWTVAAEMFADRFDPAPPVPFVLAPMDYERMLAEKGAVKIWESEYLQRLGAEKSGHPVRHFTQSTAMRPILERLDEAEAERFVAEYDSRLVMAYPLEYDGAALFPFRRLFLTLSKPAE